MDLDVYLKAEIQPFVQDGRLMAWVPYPEAPPEGVDPTWTEPLRNFNVGTTAYRWFRLEYYGEDDIYFVACGQPLDRGPKYEPPWIEHEGLHEILSSELDPDRESTVAWALKKGLCPGQPFLLRFDAPTYSAPSWEYGEVDVYTSCVLVQKLPRKERSALLAWEQTLKRMNLYEAKARRREAHFKRLRLALTHRWMIRITYSHHHETGKATTFWLELLCELSGDYKRTIARGMSQKPDFTEAFWNLVDAFTHHHPGEDVRPLLSLAGLPPLENKGIVMSRWDYLRLERGQDHPELCPVDQAL